MKKLITSQLFIVLFMISKLSIAQTSYSKQIQSGGNILFYTSSLNGSIYSSDFKVSSAGRLIHETVYSLDTSVMNYRLLQYQNVIDVAKSLNDQLGRVGYLQISNQIDELLNTIFNERGDPNLVQSLFFHKAIIKAKERFLSDGIYDCLPHPGYFLGKTYFFDQKDYFYQTDMIRGVINSHPELSRDSSTSLLKAYLDTTTQVENIFRKIL